MEFFSSRLLVQIHNFNFTSNIGQIYIDGNVYLGVRLIDKFVPGRTSTFLIDNKFYTFQNYELIHADTNIYPLSSTLAPVNARYDAINFQASTRVFSSSKFSFKNVNSFSQIISETNMMQDQLSSQFQDSDSSFTAYLPSHVFDATSSSLKHIFFQMPSITKPFLSFDLNMIFLLSLFWAVMLLPFWSIRVLAAILISTVRKPGQSHDNSAVEIFFCFDCTKPYKVFMLLLRFLVPFYCYVFVRYIM